MKKLLTLTIVAVMILGLAAATYAVELKANGFIWHFAGATCNNGLTLGFPPGPPPHYPYPDALFGEMGWDDSAAAAAMWARLQFTLEASEDLKGVYHFELGGPGNKWATPGVAQWYADDIGVEMKHAYIDFKVPGTDALPIRATVGVQPWVFSPQLISDEDGPGVNLATTVGPAAVKLAWAKMDEGLDWRSDDIDRYTATATFPVGPVTAGIWSSYYAMRDTTAFQLFPGGTTGESGYAWYTAVNGRGKAGPVSFWADFAYGTGKIDVPAPGNDNELSCWIVRANASIPVGMFTVGAEFLYGSPGDVDDLVADNEWTGWVKPPGHDGIVGNASLIYYKSYYSIIAGITTSAGSEWYAKGFASFKPMDWMTVTAQGMYIGDNVENGNMYGIAFDPAAAPNFIEDEDDVGIEVDLFVDIPVYDNLLFQIAGGYLFAGKALDCYDPAQGKNVSPDDPWAITTKLSFNF